MNETESPKSWYDVDVIDSLVRRLDVALNGEHGAARQAMLCDIVAQVERKQSPAVAVPATEDQLRAIFETRYSKSLRPPVPDGDGGYHRYGEGCTIDDDWNEWKRCWKAMLSTPTQPSAESSETVTYRKDIIFKGASVGRIGGGLELLFFADPENDEYQCEVRLDDKGIDGLIESLKFFGYPVDQPDSVQPKLAVWYGSMPESNGKTNWTAILHRADSELAYDGHTIDRSEYPERVRYEADRVRYLIGELEEMPDILAYDETVHSGYVEQPSNAVLNDPEPVKFCEEQGHRNYWLRTGELCSCKKLEVAPKLYLHPPTKPQRITEQDARDIFDSFIAHIKYNPPANFDVWHIAGKHLLAKLNKHRDQNSTAPYAYVDDQERLVKIKGITYFDGGFIEPDRAVPSSWNALYRYKNSGGDQ